MNILIFKKNILILKKHTWVYKKIIIIHFSKNLFIYKLLNLLFINKLYNERVKELLRLINNTVIILYMFHNIVIKQQV